MNKWNRTDMEFIDNINYQNYEIQHYNDEYLLATNLCIERSPVHENCG